MQKPPDWGFLNREFLAYEKYILKDRPSRKISNRHSDGRGRINRKGKKGS